MPASPLAMTRRAAIGTLAAASAGYALWPRRSRSDVPPGRRVVEYWEKWTGHEGAAMQRVVDQYNASQSRHWVRCLTISGIDTKAMVAIAGGDPPDVVGLWSFSIPWYAESGAILPLDDRAAAGGITELTYLPSVWRLLTHQGRLWAGVNTAGTVALYYRRDLLAQAGLDRPPATIDELDDFSERLTRRDAAGRLTQTGFLHQEPGWWSFLWPISFGGRLYDPATDSATATDPRVIASYQWMQSYPERLGVGPLTSFMSGFGTYNSPQMPFLEGKVAMIVQGPWVVNNIRAYRPQLDYAACPPPPVAELYHPDAPRSVVESDVLVIPRDAKNIEGAWDFVAFTQRQDIQEQLALAHCKICPMRTPSPGFVEHHTNPFIAVHNAIAQSPAVAVAPRTPVWPQFKDELVATMDAIWLMKSTPAQAMAEVQHRVEKAIEKNRRRRAIRARGADA